jgi:hypothetical protein
VKLPSRTCRIRHDLRVQPKEANHLEDNWERKGGASEVKEEAFQDGGMANYVSHYKDVRCEYVHEKSREVLKELHGFCHLGGYYF